MRTRGMQKKATAKKVRLIPQQPAHYKVQYISQPTSSSCGPTALFNLLRWGGYKPTIAEHFDDLVELTDCQDNKGIYEFGVRPHDLDSALKSVCENLNTIQYEECHYYPKPEFILETLSQNKAVVFHYRDKEPHSSHYVLLSPNNTTSQSKSIRALNYKDKTDKMTLSELEEICHLTEANDPYPPHEMDSIYPKAWVFSKN